MLYSLQFQFNRIGLPLHRVIQNHGRRWLCAASSVKQSETPETTNENSATEETFQTPSVNEETLARLNAQIKELDGSVNDWKDKYQRALADRENVRVRLEKQIADTKLYAIQGFCKDLLEISDVFRKALESVPSEELNIGNEHLKSLYDGLCMTETQMLNVFKRHGLSKQQLDKGEKFDPTWMEAMFEVPSSEVQLPGTVAHVLRAGWRLHDRCIRSAQVGVVKE